MTKDMNETMQEQEWSYFVDANKIDAQVKELNISPEQENVSRLCNRLNLLSIEGIDAKIQIQRNDMNKVVHVHGIILADVTQACVVSGEPVQAHIEDSFDAWYAEPNQAVSFTKARRERMSPKEKEEQPVLEEEDDPEPIVGGKIDVGELVVQYLSLALNPYPRKEGVHSDFGEPLEDAPDGTYNNPFAALKEWKDREKSKDQ